MAPAPSKDTASDVDKDGRCSMHGSGDDGRVVGGAVATAAGDASLRRMMNAVLVTPMLIVAASTELRLAMPAALKMLGPYNTTASIPVRC
uniref:Uncharacterized protein n=1 Tax=Oryza glumipatula TaxID=40148 RepID=A0A0D9Z4T5_9ORYZ